MFYVRRFIYFLSLLVGIVSFTFILFHMIPADPGRIILGPNANESQVESLRRELGLDKPFHVQLKTYMANVASLEFGRSYVDRRLVVQEVVEKFKVSLLLVSLSVLFIFFYTLLIPLSPKPIRLYIESLNFLLLSIPTFFSGVVFAILTFLFYPFTAFSGNFHSVSDFLYMIPPAFVLATYPMAILSRMLGQEMDKIDRSPFIMVARAKGLPEKAIRFRHILKNAIVPYLASLSNQLPMLFTGAFIVEIIFSLPGIGSLLIKSILHKDFPMLEGIVILNGFLFISVNMLMEFVYPHLDPRIKVQDAH